MRASCFTYPHDTPLAVNRNQMWREWSRGLNARDQISSWSLPTMAAASMMRRARHFRLPPAIESDFSKFTEFLGGQPALRDDYESMWDTFILPFPASALMAEMDSVVIVERTRLQDLPSQKIFQEQDSVSRSLDGLETGFPGTWLVVTLAPCAKPNTAMSKQIDYDTRESVTSTLTVGIVIFMPPEFNESVIPERRLLPYTYPIAILGMCGGHITKLWMGDEEESERPDSNIHRVGASERTTAKEWAIDANNRMSEIAINFFTAVQRPDRFIVEVAAESPLKQKRLAKATKGGSILPLSARPVYLSLTPKTIRRTLGHEPAEPGSFKKAAPHERRAHMRRLRSARFTWKRGQLVPVKASWVGPASGKTPEGREYRVRLDLVSPHVSDPQTKEHGTAEEE